MREHNVRLAQLDLVVGVGDLFAVFQRLAVASERDVRTLKRLQRSNDREPLSIFFDEKQPKIVTVVGVARFPRRDETRWR